MEHKFRARAGTPDSELIKPWPKGYSGVKHFMQIHYDNFQAHRAKKDLDILIEAILIKSAIGSITILNLSNHLCLNEYREKLKNWDMITYLPYWCGQHDIPWRRFSKSITRSKVISAVGEYKIIDLTGQSKRRRVCTNIKHVELNYTNTKFVGFI